MRSLAWLLCWLPACTLVRPLDELSSERPEPASQPESPVRASDTPLRIAGDPLPFPPADAGAGSNPISSDEDEPSEGLDGTGEAAMGDTERDVTRIHEVPLDEIPLDKVPLDAGGSSVAGEENEGLVIAGPSIDEPGGQARPAVPADAGEPGASAALCKADSECTEGRCLEAGGGCQPCPAEMSLTRFADGTAFCIDRLEVTQSQYAEFLAGVVNRPDVSAREVCEQNPSLFPSEEGACGGAFQPATTPELPVSCVDACDALAYCRWAGKRLCGKKSGGLLPRDSIGNAAKDEWQAACTEATDRLYPYGGSYSSGACNVASDAATPVGASLSCKTDGGVFDLSGNVSEWSDSCDRIDGQVRCATRGGSFAHQNPLGVACNPAATDGVDPLFAPPFISQHPHVGIRCCAD